MNEITGGKPRGKGKKAPVVALTTSELALNVDVAETLAARGINTGERVKQRKPEIYRACMKMLGYGIAPKTIEGLLGLDIRIVMSFLEEGERDGSVPLYKERTIKQLRAIVTLGLDGLLEKARDGKLGSIDIGIMLDKIELLSGGVTSRVGVVEDPRVGEFRRFMAAAQVPGMVLGEREVLQRGELAGGDRPDLEGGAEVIEVTGDIVSLESGA